MAPFFAALVYFNRDQLLKYATPQFIAIIFVVFTTFVVMINFIFYHDYFFSKWQRSGHMLEMFNDIGKTRRYKERFPVHVGRSITLGTLSDTAAFSREKLSNS